MIIVCKSIYIYVLYIHIIYKYQAKCYGPAAAPVPFSTRPQSPQYCRRAPFWISSWENAEKFSWENSTPENPRFGGKNHGFSVDFP